MDLRPVCDPLAHLAKPFQAFGRTHPCVPMLISRFLTIHRLLSANNVIRLAVFLASPRYLMLISTSK